MSKAIENLNEAMQRAAATVNAEIPATSTQKLTKFITYFVAVACSIGWLPSAARAQESNHERLIAIETPKFNEVVSNGRVSVEVRLHEGANPQTWEARLNGLDARGYFDAPTGCGQAPCEERATFPAYLLANGTNVLTVDVTGDDSSAEAKLVEFIYNDPNAQAVEMRIPGVAVNALSLPNEADRSAPANYQILVGPGPDFPQRVYTTKDLSCGAGINSAQVLVLNRETLEPTTDGTNGQACFSTASQVTDFLRSVSAGKLVILNTFYGEMPNLDTSLIGGTNFATNPAPHPYYSIIGVTGASSGQAYQSYGALIRGGTFVSPLVGSLMLDYSLRYSFVPSEYEEAELLPNHVPQATDSVGSTIMYGGTPYVSKLSRGATGGFLLLEVDRHSPQVIHEQTYGTNGPEADVQIAQLTTDLKNAPHSSLILLTTIGTPFATRTAVREPLYRAIQALAGTGHVLPRLAEMQDDRLPTYSLVSSTDPAFLSDSRGVIEESNRFIYNRSSGAVQLLLSRDRLNLWTVDEATPETHVSAGVYKKATDYGWKTVGYQQMQDWPTWSDAQRKVYDDLTDSDAYPEVRKVMGCVSTPCSKIRSFYSSYLGSGDPIPSRIPYSQLVYVSGRGYTQEEFQSVITQLEIEVSYLRNLQVIYGQFTDVWDSTQTTLQVALSDVATNLEQPLREAQENNVLRVNRMQQAAALVGNGAPFFGPSFAALSAAIRGMSFFIEQGSLIPQEYSLQLNTLINDNKQFGLVLANSNQTLFLGIVKDWGKLQTIGQGYAAHAAPWYMCDECVDQQPPRKAIPQMGLGAKRGYYRQLMPLLYSFDVFFENPAPTPRQIGGEYSGILAPCRTYYQYVENRYLGYPSINVPSTNDFYILTTTKRISKPYTDYYVVYPSEHLMNDLFLTPPSVSSDGVLTGGAGLVFDKWSSGNGRPLGERAGLIPGSRPCVAK